MSDNYQFHDTVYVDVTNGKPGIVRLVDEDVHDWSHGRTFDVDTDTWRSTTDPEIDVCVPHMGAWLDLPYRIRAIYEQHTSGDGWDINIMSDVMTELINLGVVDADEGIAA